MIGASPVTFKKVCPEIQIPLISMVNLVNKMVSPTVNNGGGGEGNRNKTTTTTKRAWRIFLLTKGDVHPII